MRSVLVASVLIVTGSYGTAARAQETAPPSYFQKVMPAPSRAFEINLATAYNQGWGNLTDTVSVDGRTFGRQVQDVAGGGLQLELDLGYRFSPMFAIAGYGTVAGYQNETFVDGTKFRSVTAGLQGQWNMSPFRSVNPWLSFGGGWRGTWVVPEVNGNTRRQAWQLARLQFGVDMRVANAIAIGPYVAGDVNLVFTETLPNGDSRNLNGTPTFATFTAGILGRFDVGGKYMTPRGTVARR